MSTAIPSPSIESALVPLTSVVGSPTNPRKHFDQVALDELTESVRKHGILQPLLVRPKGKGYELVAGERRWRAARNAGLKHVPVLVRELTDEEALEIQVIENLQRQDLHPLEEAHGYHALTRASVGYDVAKIAARVGRSVSYVRDRLKLLSLIEEAQELFREGRILPGHAVVLARLAPSDQARAIETVGALFEDEHLVFDAEDTETHDRGGKFDGMKARSVRELQGWIDKNCRFDLETPDLPDLFPETSAVLGEAREKEETVVHITREYHVIPEAKADGLRTYGPASWRRADIAYCEHAVTGVIVVGPGRGQAFKVCLEKKTCRAHWGPEIKAAAKLAKARTMAAADVAAPSPRQGTQSDWQKKHEEEQRQSRERQARYERAATAILTALAAAVEKAPTTHDGPLGQAIIRRLDEDHRVLKAEKFVPKSDLIRFAAFVILAADLGDSWEYGRDPKRVAKLGRSMGLDIEALVKESNPPTSTAYPPSGSAAKKAGATKRKK